MRVIYRIARLELSNLFYSPVAWLLLVLFVFMTGMTFAGMLERITMQQELGNGNLYAISKSMFYDGMGLWPKIQQLFYLVMPLLTMGLVSQEFSRGSIKLLFSAPITGRHIVLGKYLGIMLYGLLMIGVLLVFVAIASLTVDSFEWRAVLTGLLGLYLLFGLYAAVGLFMSTLTTYPIVAAIGMFALLALLSLVSGIWQEHAFVREITYWLSLGGRATTFIKGLICSEDILYFLIMSVMFLSFAVLKLELMRESCSFMGKTVRYSGVFVVAMLLGYVTSRPMLKWYYDGSHTKDNTLTQASQDIVAKLDGELKITTYVNLFRNILYNTTTKGINNDIARYEQYIRFKPDTKMDYVFYYYADTTKDSFKKRYPGKTLLEAAKETAKLENTRLGKYLTPEEIVKEEAAKNIDLKEEGYRFVVLLERENGQRTFLRMYDDMYCVPFETEISAALKRITMKLPCVGFLSDHKSRSVVGDRNRDYSYMVAEKTYRRSLLNQGFDVMDVNLGRNKQVLDSLDVLVVSEPQEPFSDEELEILFSYVESGKNLLVAGKPKTSSHLTPLMERLGLRFEPGILVQKPLDEYPVNLLLCEVADEARDLSSLWMHLYGSTRGGDYPFSLVMPEATAIEQVADKGFQVTPLVRTKQATVWNELETIDFVNDTARLNPKIGECAGTKMTMVGLEREQSGRKQRIIVLGDADCFSMGELATYRRGIRSANGNLIMTMFDWFSYGELPIETSRPGHVDNKLSLSMDSAAVLSVILQWILPALLLLLGVFVLFRRKGK